MLSRITISSGLLKKNVPSMFPILNSYNLMHSQDPRARIPLPSPLDGPERDLVNFPRPVPKEYCDPVRLGFIPDEWFRFMYNKTGVTGPYMLGLGVITYLCSKEIFIAHGPHFEHMKAVIMLIYLAHITPVKDIIKKATLKGVEEEEQMFVNFKEANLKRQQDEIDAEKVEQKRTAIAKYLCDAKRENVGLQLEAAYREQAMMVYNQVKRRLDYHVEVGNVDRRIKQKYMVDWVIGKVRASITPDQEKLTLKKCISDLNTLSATA